LDVRSHDIRRIGPAVLCLLALLSAPVAVAAGAARGTSDSSRAVPIELRLPADIVYGLVVGSDSAVVFSHQTHVAFAGNRCTGCHPRPFPMLRRAPTPGHRDMNAGSGCGICHDGKKAFGVKDPAECRTCHSGTRVPRMAAAGVPGSARAGAATRRPPGPRTYPRSESSPGSVTFRHESHLRGAGGCAACHPKLFKMTSSPPRPGGGMHERSACGACHDGKTAFAAEDPDACSRCHVESGARP
jgi:c(7)-type cytochrome triheme protein